MNLNELPEDTLLCLLEWAAFNRSGYNGEFSVNLKLLAVCQRWRALAKPVVYQKAHIRFGMSKTSETDNPYDLQSIQEVADPVIDSNLELVKLSESVESIKSVELLICHKVNPLPFLNKAISMLRDVAKVWTLVRSLEIMFYPNEYLVIESEVSAKPFELDIKQTGHLLVELFPNVQSAEFKGSDSDAISDDLCSMLSSHYSSQLLKLRSVFTIDPLKLQPFRKLCYLDFSINNSPFQLPRVCAASLNELDMHSVASKLDWSLLSDDENSSIVTFSNMRKLTVKFRLSKDESTLRQPNDKVCMLQFPRLQNLTLRNHSPICPFLEAARLPNSLEKLSISAAKYVYEMLGQHNLKSIGELDAVIILVDQQDAHNFFLPVNRLIDTTSPNNSKLEIVGRHIKLDADNIRFTNLNRMDISIPIDLATLVGIVCNNPCLNILRIWELEIKNAPESVELLDSCKHDMSVVTPFDSKLENLVLSNRPQYAPAKAIPIVKYLLTTLPNLKIMSATRVSSEQIHEFIEQNKEAMPNLNNLSFYGA